MRLKDLVSSYSFKESYINLKVLRIHFSFQIKLSLSKLCLIQCRWLCVCGTKNQTEGLTHASQASH